jgi:hypothetical protein
MRWRESIRSIYLGLEQHRGHFERVETQTNNRCLYTLKRKSKYLVKFLEQCEAESRSGRTYKAFSGEHEELDELVSGEGRRLEV